MLNRLYFICVKVSMSDSQSKHFHIHTWRKIHWCICSPEIPTALGQFICELPAISLLLPELYLLAMWHIVFKFCTPIITITFATVVATRYHNCVYYFPSLHCLVLVPRHWPYGPVVMGATPKVIGTQSACTEGHTERNFRQEYSRHCGCIYLY